MADDTVGKLTTKEATVGTAFGMKLEDMGFKPITFTFEYHELQKEDEIPSDEYPSDDDIRDLVNQNRLAAARSKRQAEVLKEAGVKKPDLKNDDFAILQFKKALMLRKPSLTDEQATQQAKMALGIE